PCGGAGGARRPVGGSCPPASCRGARRSAPSCAAWRSCARRPRSPPARAAMGGGSCVVLLVRVHVVPVGTPLHRNPRRTRRWRIFARDIGHFAQGEVPFTRVRSPGNGGDTGGCESGRTEVMTVTVPHLRAAHPDADAELMAAVIEQAPTPLWVIAGGRVELVNRAAVSLLGYSTAADLVGQASHCALHE